MKFQPWVESLESRRKLIVLSNAVGIYHRNAAAMEGRANRLYAVTLPFLAHSHFNVFLHLSRMLATRGVTVIYVTLPSNIQFLRSRVVEWDELPFYFHDLSVADSPLPQGSQNVNNISRNTVPMLFDLVHKMREPLEGFMAELTGQEYYESRGLPPPDRLVLIYDFFMGWSAPVAAKFGVRSFTFNPHSAHLWMCGELEFLGEGEQLPEVTDAIDRLATSPDFLVAEIHRHMELTRLFAEGILLNTFAELEPKFVQHVQSRGGSGKPVWMIGPVIDLPGRQKIHSTRDAEIVGWLDRQTPGSVVYVSFGSESYISPEQVTELALGLEESGQPFLWVLRPPDSTARDDGSSSAKWKEEVLPEGYERRLGVRCLIETSWAPQAAVLAHKATGGFITHCGWNSALESVAVGVPMIALPLQSDQPANALLLAKEAKVAVQMKIGDDGIAKRNEVELAVRSLMAMEEMKLRVKGLSKAVMAALSEGGVAWKNLDSFINYWL